MRKHFERMPLDMNNYLCIKVAKNWDGQYLAEVYQENRSGIRAVLFSCPFNFFNFAVQSAQDFAIAYIEGLAKALHGEAE